MGSNQPLWQLHTGTDVLFGVGAVDRASKLLAERKTLIVTSSGAVERGTVATVISPADPQIVKLFSGVKSHHSLVDIEKAAVQLSTGNIECILAIGGGSVIDTAKCLSVLLTPGESSLLRVMENNASLIDRRSIPIIAVPTTSGSGSEVTPFATVWDYEQKKKFSLATELVRPQVAIIDPSLTLSLPQKTTISSGLDAISHAFESVWNRNATASTIENATQALKLGLSSIERAADHPEDITARESMSEASLLAGIAISHTRTALAHSISYPLTAHMGLDHGFACSITLPAILKFNSEVDDGRLAELSIGLCVGKISDLEKLLVDRFSSLNLPEYLEEFDLTASRLAELSPEMVNPQRSDNNMRPLHADSIDRVLTDTVDVLQKLKAVN
jgi:alcohol dehydrogenase